jgi:hypothetical protein
MARRPRSAARRRTKPASLACIYCKCTETNACLVEDLEGNSVGCSWISTKPPVCSAPACVAKLKVARDNPRQAAKR